MFIVFGPNQLLFADKIWFEQKQVNFGNRGTTDGVDVAFANIVKIGVSFSHPCYDDLVHMSRHIFIFAKPLRRLG